MKPTTEAYREQMARQFRGASKVRIIVQQVAVGARGDGSFADNGHMPWSEFGSVDAGIAAAKTYATFEDDRLRRDGTMPFVPDDGAYHQEGFVGDALSKEDGTYTTNPLIVRQFTQIHALVGLTIGFDELAGDFPRHIIIRFYLGGSEVDSVELFSISAPLLVVSRIVPATDGFTIEILENRAYRRARIQRILYGVEKVFDNVQIEAGEMVADVDPISRRLPTETMAFTVFDFEGEYDPDNPAGIWEYIDIQSPVVLQVGQELDNGVTEWLEPDAYLLDGRPETGDYRATFKATKVIGYMSDRYYKGTAGSKSLYAVAESILQDAGLPLTDELQNPWYIDPALQSIYTSAAIPTDTHKNCLQLVAHAGMCRLYTDGTGIVRLERMAIPDTAEDFTLDFDSAESIPVITKIEPLYSVTVMKYTPTAAATTTELHRSVFSVSGTTEFYAEFEAAQDVSMAITGGTLSNVQTYARAAAATITASGSVTVVITGKKIETATNGVTYIAGLTGETEIVENPLVTDAAHAAQLAEHLAGYLSMRNAYTVDYRGNPELQPGDLINLQSAFTPSFPALVLRHVISFGAGLKGQGIFKKVV